MEIVEFRPEPSQYAYTFGGVAVFRHATPLEDLSFVEFDAPFRLVTRIADQLEHALTGADKY